MYIKKCYSNTILFFRNGTAAMIGRSAANWIKMLARQVRKTDHHGSIIMVWRFGSVLLVSLWLLYYVRRTGLVSGALVALRAVVIAAAAHLSVTDALPRASRTLHSYIII